MSTRSCSFFTNCYGPQFLVCLSQFGRVSGRFFIFRLSCLVEFLICHFWGGGGPVWASLCSLSFAASTCASMTTLFSSACTFLSCRLHRHSRNSPWAKYPSSSATFYLAWWFSATPRSAHHCQSKFPTRWPCLSNFWATVWHWACWKD